MASSRDHDSEGPPTGDHQPPADLLPLVYKELRRIAQQQMNTERAGHTLGATELVHAAYLKLAGGSPRMFRDRVHFYHAAAIAMRQILVDHARARTRGKRGGLEARRAAVELTDLPKPESDEESEGFLILDEAICRLENMDADAAAVVKLRYFAGLSVDETAEALGISGPTVKRRWAFARAWLREAIEAG